MAKQKSLGWLDKYQEGGWTVSPKAAAYNKAAKQTPTNIDANAMEAIAKATSYPQRKVVEWITGKNQYPSQAMGIQNPIGAFAVDAIADPVNLIGAGLLGKAAKLSGKAGVIGKVGKAAEAINKATKGESAIIAESNKLAPPPSEIIIPGTEINPDIQALRDRINVGEKVDRLRHTFWNQNSTNFLNENQLDWLSQHGGQNGSGVGNRQLYEGVPVNNLSDSYIQSLRDELSNQSRVLTPVEMGVLRERGLSSPAQANSVMGMPIPSNITPSPSGGLFGMTSEQLNTFANRPLDISSLTTPTSLRGRLDQSIRSALGMNTSRNVLIPNGSRQSALQSFGESIYTALGGGRRSHNQYVPLSQLEAEQNIGRGMTNISGFGNQQLLASDAVINKDVVAKMAPEEFASTVYKPSGEVTPYQYTYEPLQGVESMSRSEYVNKFNEQLDLLNSIIAKNNKTGVTYNVTGLSDNGMLTFNTPKQVKRWQDDPFKVTSVENLEKLKNDPVELQKRLQTQGITLEDFDRVINSFKEDKVIVPEGTRTWSANITPGKFKGDVQDIANTQYYQSIPGLSMGSSSQGVFADSVTRRGSGAYESLNEYLKALDLGRVKPGFNSQTNFSRGLWENAVKKGKAFGYYSNPHTVHGVMKTVAPVVGAGAVASQFVDQKKDGGWLSKYDDGGPVQPNYNDASVSVSDDFVGDGYNTKGRNYSPAWGGQFQSGGYLSPEQYNKKHPPIYVSNPKDSRIGFYSPAGNQYLYKKPIQPVAKKPQPTPQSVIDWIEGKDENAPTRLTTSEDFAMGGSMPGAVGFTYARVAGSAPSKGPYGKKTPASAQNGMEMKYYQEGLDFKPKTISKNGSKVIKDDRGQWAHPGKVTQIGSNQITMQGVPYPVLGISDTGDMQMMYPNQEYQYDGSSVTEYPMMAQGGQLTKLDQLTNFTNYNTKQPGGWLDKYQ